MSRIILIPLALVVLLVVAAALLLPVLLDEQKVLELASNALQEQTGATLTVGGDTELSIFPTLGVALGDAAITMPGRQDPDLTVASLAIGVQLRPLLSGQVEIDTIDVAGLWARIESAADDSKVDTGRMNDAELDAWYTRRRGEKASAGAAAGAEAALTVPMALNVTRLSVTDARLEMIDTAAGTTTVIELPSLQARDLNLGGTPIPLQLALRLPGEQPVEVDLTGSIRVDQDSQQASFEALEVGVRGATAQPLVLRAGGTVDLSRQVADLQVNLELGETRGQGKLRYASFESPQIDADLGLNLFDPALLALAGPEAAGAAPDSGDAGGDEPLPLDAIRSIDTRAVLAIEQARFGKHTMENLQVRLRALEGVIDITKLTGDLHGGKLDALATFNGKHNTATLSTSGSVSDLDIAAALAATDTTASVTGGATLDWQLQSRGRTANALTGALGGPIKLDTAEVVLQGTSVEKLLCQAVALTNKEQLTARFPASTSFRTLSADLQMADGKAVLRPLRAELFGIALTGSGNFDLLHQDFDATFKARLSPELEELDRACRVSKRLTAIDWPVNCAGNVSTEPGKWCMVDTEQIITDLAVGEGRRKLEKEAGKLFDKLRKKLEK